MLKGCSAGFCPVAKRQSLKEYSGFFIGSKGRIAGAVKNRLRPKPIQKGAASGSVAFSYISSFETFGQNFHLECTLTSIVPCFFHYGDNIGYRPEFLYLFDVNKGFTGTAGFTDYNFGAFQTLNRWNEGYF